MLTPTLFRERWDADELWHFVESLRERPDGAMMIERLAHFNGEVDAVRDVLERRAARDKTAVHNAAMRARRGTGKADATRGESVTLYRARWDGTAGKHFVESLRELADGGVKSTRVGGYENVADALAHVRELRAARDKKTLANVGKVAGERARRAYGR